MPATHFSAATVARDVGMVPVNWLLDKFSRLRGYMRNQHVLQR